MTFVIPCWYQSVPSVIINHVTDVSTSRSLLNLLPSRFCCSPESWRNPLATNLIDVFTVSLGSLITTLQAIQNNFITKHRIIYDNFIILITQVITMVLSVRHSSYIHSLQYSCILVWTRTSRVCTVSMSAGFLQRQDEHYSTDVTAINF